MNPRRRKVLWIALGSLFSLMVVASISLGIFVAQSQWFRDFVRTKIVQTVEDSTGGKVEIASFGFDWRRLRADIEQFALHGTEPVGAKPLLWVRHLRVELRFASLFRTRKVDIASLTVDQPQVNVIVFPDGRTNVPNPHITRSGDQNGLQTIVDLAIGRFAVNNGSIDFADQKANYQASGENLQARLIYEAIVQRYRGQVSMTPLYFQSGRNPRLNIAVNLPLVIERDRIQLKDAILATASSKVTLDAVLEHLAAPVLSGRLNAQLDVLEMRRTLGLSIPAATRDHTLNTLYADVEMKSDQNNVQIRAVKLALGQSTLQAFGTMRNLALEKGSLQFSADLNVRETGEMLQFRGRADGRMRIDGTATTKNASDYSIDASVGGQQLALRQGDVSISNASLNAKVRANPKQISANPLRVSIAGGTFDGSANLVDRAEYKVEGKINNFAIQEVAATLTGRRPAWSGIIAGPVDVKGNLRSSKESSLQAHARLIVSPGNRGVPVSGQLNAHYDGPADSLEVGRSYFAFPASRLEFSGSLKDGMDVRMTSANLNDFLPGSTLFSNRPATNLPVKFDTGGSIVLDAHLMGTLRSPQVTGHVAARRFVVEERQFDRLTAELAATQTGASIKNGVLTRGPLQAQLSGSVGLDQWELKASAPLHANVVVRNADVQDVLALTGQSRIPIRGDLALSAQASGTAGDPQGSADLTIVNGAAYDQPFDRIQGKVNYGEQFVNIPSMQMSSGSALANLAASFEHPLNSFSTGRLHVHVDTNQVALDRLPAIQRRRPDLGGLAQTNLDADATLQSIGGNSSLQIAAVSGNITVRGLRARGRNLGDFTADARTAGTQLSYRIDSNFAGSNIRADGKTALIPEYPTTASISIQNLPIEQALALAGRDDFPARGLLSTKGQLSGSLHDPRADLDVDLTKAVVYKQPFDRIEGHVNYSNVLVDLPSLNLSAGPNRLTLAGSFSHPIQDLSRGDLRLHVASNSLELGQIQYVKVQRPGLSGQISLNIDGAAAINTTGPTIRLASLKGTVSSSGLRMNGRDYGEFHASAEQIGSMVNVDLDSNLAQSTIAAKFQTELVGDYKTSGQLTFKNVSYSNWSGLLGLGNTRSLQNFDAVAEGSVNGSVAILKPANLRGTAQLSKLEISAKPKAALAGPPRTATLALRNEGPIEFTASQSAIHVQRASLVGNSTRIAVTGSVALEPVAFDLAVDGDANLALLHDLDPDISSDGKLALNARVQGPFGKPTANGRLQLKDAAFQTEDMPTGISKANGVIQFSGDVARIESLTAESGGGKITVTGFVGRSGSTFTYALAARANQVRVRQASGVSVIGNANVKLNGTNESSLLSGDVNIRTVKFNPQSDFGSILASSTPPTETTASRGPLNSMKLNLNVRTATGASFQTSVAENLRVQGALTVRGTVANPGVLGRVTVTEGVLIFFGTKYTVNDAAVSFYNPNKIEPILNLSLVTKARGVEVTLNVSGPINNMNLAYQSDPPLPFTEIVGLLAAGQNPTSDPVLVAHQPSTPPQNLQQMGGSALLSQAVSNPIAGQLQRVFGVSQLKIDPTFTGGSELPQARLTMQQQITSGLTFTYITNLTQPDAQIVRVEWALNAEWSLIATREDNGLFGVDFFYKRRFR